MSTSELPTNGAAQAEASPYNLLLTTFIAAIFVSAALLSSRHELAVNPIGVGTAAVIGAVLGDSTGYAIGRRLSPCADI